PIQTSSADPTVDLLSLAPEYTYAPRPRPAPPSTRRPPRPKVLPHKVLHPSHIPPCDRYGTFPFDKPHHPSHRVLRWYRQQQVHIVAPQVPLHHHGLFLLCQIPKNRTQLTAKSSVDHLLAIFRNEHYVIFAFPNCVL